ncbi:MAG: ethanolamine ammonia-lyase subunit EutC [Myxococcales bacterium]|nr:ethanolamine ammonia-lyase subunit EutC [Myxococcales bacterium]
MSGSLTRALVAEVRARRGASDPMPPRIVLPPVVAPPARVYAPRRPPLAPGAGSDHTTALLGIGHVGTRYATDVVLQFQAELAVAHEAVAAELTDGWARDHGFLALQTRVADHREFLLRPDLGRRLAAESLERLRAHAPTGVDVQVILADGLSASACMQAGPTLYQAVVDAVRARGLTVGAPVCARFARVWLEDEIGQEVGAKVAMILLGERPGLGTGDGLSAYLVHAPALGKTDGDRNMMSNLHARGTPPEDAAPRLAALAQAMIAQGTSGVGLDLGQVDAVIERGYRAPQVRQRLVERGGGR